MITEEHLQLLTERIEDHFNFVCDKLDKVDTKLEEQATKIQKLEAYSQYLSKQLNAKDIDVDSYEYFIDNTWLANLSTNDYGSNYDDLDELPEEEVLEEYKKELRRRLNNQARSKE